MLSESLRCRLEFLNRSMAGGDAVPNLPSVKPAPASLPLPGSECVNGGGCYWHIQRPLHDLWLTADAVIAKSQQGWLDPSDATHNTKRDRLLVERQAFQIAFPQRVLLMDLETCGLAGSTIFLVGLLAMDHEGWQLMQLWARNYAEEKAVLQGLWQIARQYDVLVTFNGKTFDWPQVHARSTIHHVGKDPALESPQPPSQPQATLPQPSLSFPAAGQRPSDLTPHDSRPQLVHFDLLHHARRVWKTELPNCRLQTLERSLCGRTRYDDIPGRVIPAAYQDYVRTGDTRQVRRILHHNELDLLTLLQVTLRLMESLPQRNAEALFSARVTEPISGMAS